jgi:exodeoxyribonuclease V alpha subunit
MRADPGAGEVLWLEGTLTRVLWSSERTGYAVMRLGLADGREVVAVGPLASLAGAPQGTFVAIEGRWTDHPVHGMQLTSTGYLQGTPRSLAGLKMYLGGAGISGIGPTLANRIVDAFGLSSLSVLAEQPERLREVPGIGASRAAAIQEAWARDGSERAMDITLRGLGVPGRLIDRIKRRYGDKASTIVSGEPYRLAEEIRGIGFRTADALARAQGIPPDHPGRLRAAVGHVVGADQLDGHCYLPIGALEAKVRELGVATDRLDDAILEAEGRGHVVRDPDQPDRIWSARLYDAEIFVANELQRLHGSGGIAPDSDRISRAERWEGRTLDPTQRGAVAQALGGGMVVITGGPGTGKTTTLKVLLRAAEEVGASWALASPTGRAARRLAEATGRPASTIHRLLEYQPGAGGFTRNASNPLECDGLVIDEASMVDLPLMRAVLEALPWELDGFALVLVGDADQLPSVGPGQVLRDLVGGEGVNTVVLGTVHRQASDSGILDAATAIHAGRVPTSGERGGKRDVFLIERNNAQDALNTLVTIVADRLPANGFDPLTQIQVLAPTHGGPLGTRALNKALQERLNPSGPAFVRGNECFRVRDRVICLRNRYDFDVFNGDVGVVERVEEDALHVRFDDRDTRWKREDLSQISLGYAITVHKSQGSEYPAVVLALHPSHGLMLQRTLFYTAATRAVRFLTVVGAPRAWSRAARTQRSQSRHTALRERLKKV